MSGSYIKFAYASFECSLIGGFPTQGSEYPGGRGLRAERNIAPVARRWPRVMPSKSGLLCGNNRFFVSFFFLQKGAFILCLHLVCRPAGVKFLCRAFNATRQGLVLLHSHTNYDIQITLLPLHHGSHWSASDGKNDRFFTNELRIRWGWRCCPPAPGGGFMYFTGEPWSVGRGGGLHPSSVPISIRLFFVYFWPDCGG